jgi:hypothetical protein
MYFRDVFGDFPIAFVCVFLLKVCHLLGELGQGQSSVKPFYFMEHMKHVHEMNMELLDMK